MWLSFLPNCPQFFIAEMGAWKTGAIVCPVNPTYTERELESSLNSTGAQTVITLTPFYARLKEVQSRTAVRTVIATSIKEHLPPLCACCSRSSRKNPRATAFRSRKAITGSRICFVGIAQRRRRR